MADANGISYYEIPLSPQQQKLSISLSGVVYQLIVTYHQAGGAGWCLDFSNATTGNIVCGIPLVTGTNLLGPYEYLGFNAALFAYTDGDLFKPPTYNSLGQTSHVIFATGIPASTLENPGSQNTLPTSVGSTPTPSGVVLPSAPSSLVPSNVTNSSVDLTWNIPNRGTLPFTYEIDLSTDQTNWTIFAKQLANTEVSVTGLNPSKQYYFRTAAQNQAGTGPYSPIAQATTLGSVVLPGAPTNLQLTQGAADTSNNLTLLDGGTLNLLDGTPLQLSPSTTNPNAITLLDGSTLDLLDGTSLTTS